MTLGEYLRENSTSGTQSGFTPLGEILLRRGQIRRYQLDFALKLQGSYLKMSQHRLLGKILTEHRAINPKTLERALEIQKELPKESVTEVVKKINKAVEDEESNTKLIEVTES